MGPFFVILTFFVVFVCILLLCLWWCILVVGIGLGYSAAHPRPLTAASDGVHGRGWACPSALLSRLGQHVHVCEDWSALLCIFHSCSQRCAVVGSCTSSWGCRALSCVVAFSMILVSYKKSISSFSCTFHVPVTNATTWLFSWAWFYRISIVSVYVHPCRLSYCIEFCCSSTCLHRSRGSMTM